MPKYIVHRVDVDGLTVTLTDVTDSVIVDEIDNAPSVVPTTEQSSMVGEWKWESQDTCDNCGYEIPHLERIVGETVLMDSRDWEYCPNCGAKMKR